MAEQKSPCGCGCQPLKGKENKAADTAKTVKQEKKEPKKAE